MKAIEKSFPAEENSVYTEQSHAAGVVKGGSLGWGRRKLRFWFGRRWHDRSIARRVTGSSFRRGSAGSRRVAYRRSRIENHATGAWRSEEHTSELQSLMRISYAVFCLKKKNED